MNTINRFAVIIRPKQPFLQWTNSSIPDNPHPITFEDLHSDPTIYLIPSSETTEAAHKFVRTNYGQIFMQELRSLDEDEESYPDKVNWEIFQEWFEVEIHTMVFDLSDEPIEHDEF